MVISSRTPEGDPNRCPICRHEVRMEPSITTRDAPCPNCGHLLWFDTDAVDRSAKATGTLTDVIVNIAVGRLGTPSEADRVAVIEALEKLGAGKVQLTRRGGPPGEMTLMELGKVSGVDVLAKTLNARTWKDLIEGLAQRQ